MKSNKKHTNRLFAILLCIATLMLAMPGTGYAQRTKMRIPVISLGRIPRSEVKDGKPIPTLSTRYAILKNSLLLADLNNCRVVAYKFSMIAPGRGFYGPVYVRGGNLTDSLKHKIRETEGPGVKLYMEDIKMLYRGDTMDANPVYVKYDE